MAYNFLKHYEESFAKEKAMKDENNIREWNKTREELVSLCNSLSKANHVYVSKNGSFCPYILYARFDALDPKDYPNGIKQNSIFIDFRIDLFTNKVEVNSNGSVWLSPFDKASEKYKYFVMKSMESILVDNGGKKFRKSSFKDAKDLFCKMENYYLKVMKEVTDYTGGYPFKQGIKEAA